MWSASAKMNTARFDHGMAVYKGDVTAMFKVPTGECGCCVRAFHTCHSVHVFAGRVLVYGGGDVHNDNLASVEMLSVDRRVWQTLPTRMFYADSRFASVPLP